MIGQYGRNKTSRNSGQKVCGVASINPTVSAAEPMFLLSLNRACFEWTETDLVRRHFAVRLGSEADDLGQLIRKTYNGQTACYVSENSHHNNSA